MKLEQEVKQAQVELTETQKQLQELESKHLSDVALKAKLQKEFCKKMDAAKLRVQVFKNVDEEIHLRLPTLGFLYLVRKEVRFIFYQQEKLDGNFSFSFSACWEVYILSICVVYFLIQEVYYCNLLMKNHVVRNKGSHRKCPFLKEKRLTIK